MTTTDKRMIVINQRHNEDPDEALSKTLLKPEVTASYCMQTFEEMHTVSGLRAALTEQIDEIHSGNMKRPEAMLLTQAVTLDALFNKLAARAHDQDNMSHFESFLRLALKAQGQCRVTLEALAAIKNPPVIFAKQANISNGHQQINNGVSQAENFQNQPNELLEHTHGERLDTRTKGKAVSANSELEAVGSLYRGSNR